VSLQEASVQAWAALVVALGGIGGLVAAYFRGQRSLEEKIDKKITCLEERMDKRLTDQKQELVQRMHESEDRYHQFITASNERLHKLEMEMQILKTQTEVWLSVMQKELPKIAMREDEKEIDRLLSKFEHNDLTKQGKKELVDKLREAISRNTSKAEPEQDRSKNLIYLITIATIESKEKADELRDQFGMGND
jgi:hypothetical protein